MKRLIDFTGSLIFIILLSPVLAFFSIAIKLSSKGPVVFKQRRIGKNGIKFFMYKFRTMYLEAPQNVATHLLNEAEKYITPLGRIMRKTSLDELPQLFNIIKGEMSFVGPRPALYNQYDLIELREKNGVNALIPGITGWAQVNGRDELSIQEKAELDRYYMEKYSIWMDIKIVILTFINVFRAKGIVEGRKPSTSPPLSKSGEGSAT